MKPRRKHKPARVNGTSLAQITRPRLWNVPIWLVISPMAVKQSLLKRMKAVELRINRVAVANAREFETIVGELEALATCFESRQPGADAKGPRYPEDFDETM